MGSSQASRASVESFKSDPLFPRIERAVAAILATTKIVTPIDVLVRLDLLAPVRVDDWRQGRLPYLERAINCNLTRLSRILRILRFHAHDLNLVPVAGVYPQRFSKTGDRGIEAAYARHFVWPGKLPFHPPAPKT